VKLEFKVYASPKPWVVYVRKTARSNRSVYMGEWQEAVGKAAADAYDGCDVLRCEPVRIDTHFFLQPPKASPKLAYQAWRDKRIVEPGRGNPDLDNLRKATIDGLQEVIIADDSLVIAGYMTKQYVCKRDDNPYAHILIFTGEDLCRAVSD
jgi:Holliday junction resolvase RusA-like endonuclease